MWRHTFVVALESSSFDEVEFISKNSYVLLFVIEVAFPLYLFLCNKTLFIETKH